MPRSAQSGATHAADGPQPHCAPSAAPAVGRPTGCVVADVVPWAGRAVVFPHRTLHESMPIVAGRKFVMRGDVLYGPRDGGTE